ncbi:MAG: hypothetical protein ACRENQ_13735, partial [Gemmatimonadaceae bacterium]
MTTSGATSARGRGHAMQRNTRKLMAPWMLVGPGVLWLAVFCVVPVLTLVRASMATARGPWWDGYLRAVTQYGG